MHLVVDCAGQQMLALAVYFLGGSSSGDLVTDLFDPAIPDENILRQRLSFVHYSNILYQVIFHNIDSLYAGMQFIIKNLRRLHCILLLPFVLLIIHRCTLTCRRETNTRNCSNGLR